MKCGAAKVNITPPLGCPLSGYSHRSEPSNEVADDLFARALFLDDGDTQVAMVVCDLLTFPKAVTAQVRRAIEDAMRIPGSNVIVAATHTHFGPLVQPALFTDRPSLEQPDPAYIGFLRKALPGVAQMAADRAVEAQVRAGRDRTTALTYNRRLRTKDGVEMAFTFPSEAEESQFGPTDQECSVAVFESASGERIATLTNFACHPVVGSDNPLAVSADYPGEVCRRLEGLTGGLCLFATGACGDVNPVLKGNEEGREQMGMALAGAALRASELAGPISEERIAIDQRVVWLPAATLPSPEEARQQVAALREQGETHALLLARRRLQLAEEMPGVEQLKTAVQRLDLGDLSIVALPGEVFVEIGLAVKEQSGAALTMVVELANDSLGYVPTDQDFKHGGYEPLWTRVGRGAAELLIRASNAPAR